MMIMMTQLNELLDFLFFLDLRSVRSVDRSSDPLTSKTNDGLMMRNVPRLCCIFLYFFHCLSSSGVMSQLELDFGPLLYQFKAVTVLLISCVYGSVKLIILLVKGCHIEYSAGG